MGGKCLLGKGMVNSCNLCSHCLFIFGHPMILVDCISECIARCVSEMLTLLLGCSQASFCFLLAAVLGAQGWVLLLPIPLGGACWAHPAPGCSWDCAHPAPHTDPSPGWLWLPGCSLLVGSLALIFTQVVGRPVLANFPLLVSW